MHYSKKPTTTQPMAAARAFCERAWIRPESVALLTQGMTPSAFLQQLLEKEHYTDAIRMMARQLSRRQAIWWGCLCLEHDRGADLTESESAILCASLCWVLAPSEEHRRAADKAARAEDASSPAGLLGRAVFWSSGSLSKPNYPKVPPPEGICAQGIASSLLLLAANYSDPLVRQRRRKEFLDLARLIRTGELHWKERTQDPPAPISKVEASVKVAS